MLFHAISAPRADGVVTRARLESVGLTGEPAYATAVWLDDDIVTDETVDLWRRFRIADMSAAAARYAPAPRPARPVKVAASKGDKAKKPKPSLERLENWAARAFKNAVMSGEMERELIEMKRLHGR
ncbi:hypothetical protein HH303_19915 [Rhodospirillaceae bacterium KN72]|uniref:Uncharacterized protein n=2 Tax=Pacificispira spongiicola TaxID=2729598 RepID=A0A7Y0E3X3_9PROT|nr:hypothetical protein [Pacificispira spongiicola]